jgi:hypothetical protein
VSGFSPVTLSLLELVFVVALCLAILAVRRGHPDHVHTSWYVFSLTLCSVSVLSFYAYENSRAIQSAPLGGMAGTTAVRFMKASMDVREGIYILLTAGALSYCRKYSAILLTEHSVADSPSRQKPLESAEETTPTNDPDSEKRFMPECSKSGQTAEGTAEDVFETVQQVLET